MALVAEGHPGRISESPNFLMVYVVGVSVPFLLLKHSDGAGKSLLEPMPGV
jgi:hypothetical protein